MNQIDLEARLFQIMETYEAALQFYADEKTWQFNIFEGTPIHEDKGTRARKALGKLYDPHHSSSKTGAG